MSVYPLSLPLQGVADANGNATLRPGTFLSKFGSWSAYFTLTRPGASVTCLVAGQPAGTAFGVSPQLGPVVSLPNQAITFLVSGVTPGSQIVGNVTGYQADLPDELPALGSPAGNTIVSVAPMDGALIYSEPDGTSHTTPPPTYTAGPFDVSQWQSVATRALATAGSAVLTYQWFASDGTTLLGQQLVPIDSTLVASQAVRSLLPNMGPLLKLTVQPLTTPFTWGIAVLQSNRLRPSLPYAVDNPMLVELASASINNGVTNTLPFLNVYGGPIGFRYLVPAVASSTVQIWAMNEVGTYQLIYSDPTISASKQVQLMVPATSCQIRITNNTGAAGTYSAFLWPSLTGSS